jgi:hypothetical protein
LSWEPFKYIPHQQKGKKTLEGQTKPFSLQKVSLTLMKPEISSASKHQNTNWLLFKQKTARCNQCSKEG